jgi:hypothetical protein
MFEFKVIKKVEVPTISEEVLKEMLIKAIAEKLPEDVVVNGVEFVVTRKGGTAINLEVDAQFADAEPEKKEVQLELPIADDVPEEEEEVTLSRDGVLTSEMSLIDEVLAEEEEAPFETEPEEAPVTTGKSIAELFG